MDAKRLIALFLPILALSCSPNEGFAATPLINCTGSNQALQSTANPPQYSCATIAGGGGSGTVSSFSAGNLSPLFTTSVINSTTTPALSFSLTPQAANTVYAGQTAGSPAAPLFRSLVGADLPTPTVSTLGGVEAYNTVAHQFLTGISSLGVPLSAQPAFSDISGTATAAQGGTGVNAGSAANGSLLIGNGSGFSLAPLTAGANITITNGSGGITIASSGGGSVSVTAATPDIVINPSPGTSTFTVGATSLLNAQGATTPYTVVAGDMGKTVTHSKSTAVAVTLPQAGTTGFNTGASYSELNLNTGVVTVTPTASTINGNTSLKLHQYGWTFPISDGSNYVSMGFPGFDTITTNAITKFSDASGAWTASGLLDNGTTISTGETITFTGSTSGSVKIGAQAVAGSGTVFNFPATNGTNTYVLSTDGSGNTSWIPSAGGGTVTTASVVTANGFGGSVANPTTTPAITLTTSCNGICKGNGTAISTATANTDYQGAITLTTTGTSGAATLTGATLNIPQYAPNSNSTKRDVSFAFDGGGSALTAGKIIYVSNIPYSGTITGVTLLADQSCSATVDVWKVAYASAPPTISNTIVASDMPTLSSAQKSNDTTLTGWTTSITAGDTMAFKLTTSATCQYISGSLQVTAN